jgi:phage FluMu protein Com
LEKKVVTAKSVSIRCPECLNYMKAKVAKSGTYSGKCPVCKSSVFSKQYSERERHIRIVRNTAN